jgi:hypothetical protein
MDKGNFLYIRMIVGSTVVENTHSNPDIKGLNPATSQKERK